MKTVRAHHTNDALREFPRDGPEILPAQTRIASKQACF